MILMTDTALWPRTRHGSARLGSAHFSTQPYAFDELWQVLGSGLILLLSHFTDEDSEGERVIQASVFRKLVKC